MKPQSTSVVASGHPCVTRVGCEILRAGGNAFDAAAACGFASTVAEPGLTSLGGGGFLLARTADGRATLFDFFVDTPGRGLRRRSVVPHFLPVTVRFPGSEQMFHVGLGSAGVPGNLRGLLHVHRRLGRLPLSEVVSPAARVAREGIRLNEGQAHVLDLLRPILTLTPRGRSLFAPRGRYLRRGERFRNPELASFLETLESTGERDFYQGDIAQAIAREARHGGGFITAADLRAYRVIERAPLRARYRGLDLLTNPPPSLGGALLASLLRLLEAVSANGLGLRFGSTRHLALLVALFQEVERRRAQHAAGAGDLSHGALGKSVARIRTASGGTTHVSVCDGEGNVASMTTSNGEGSGYIVPGTGIVLNNMLGEEDLHPDGFHASPAGKRVASMMSPSVLLDGSRVKLVFGSGGSKRIRTALLQVLSNIVDFGMDVRAAVRAPRVHWDGARVQLEPGFPQGARFAREHRWPVNVWHVRDVYFGGVHALSPDGQGAGDPRRGGSAARA